MRKTARPVVWEGAGAQSPALDPIQGFRPTRCIFKGAIIDVTGIISISTRSGCLHHGFNPECREIWIDESAGSSARNILKGVLGTRTTKVVEKKPGSRQYRNLMVPAVRDRIAQTAVARLLTRDWEQAFLGASFAYRPGRGVDLAIEQIVAYRDQGFTWLLDADITGCFDNIPIHALENRLAGTGALLPLLRLWIRCFIWDGHRLEAMKRGIVFIPSARPRPYEPSVMWRAPS